MSGLFHYLQNILPLDLSRISFLLTLLSCMTSQSAVPRVTSSSSSSSSSSPSILHPLPLSACPQRCNDHGDCIHGNNDVIKCQCHVGWSGNSCSQPCDKRCAQGKCQIVGHVEVCICRLGYHGDRCQHKNMDVTSVLHMAKMLSHALWNKILPLVQDPAPKLEKMIQNDSSDCSSSFRCQNGGKCKHGEMGGYRCQCVPSKFTGDFCQFACPHPCLNGGKCIRYRKKSTSSPASSTTTSYSGITDGTNLQYACACPKEYSGRYCQRKRGPNSSTSYS